MGGRKTSSPDAGRQRPAVRVRQAFVAWLTGVPAAGKSTIVRAVQAELQGGSRVEILDGDEFRRALSPELGFARADRRLNVARLAYVAGLLTRNGVTALVAAVSPYRDDRNAARSSVACLGVPFLEIHVRAGRDELIRRDPKGLYRQARLGRLEGLTGFSAPYEEPLTPDLVIHTDGRTIGQCRDDLITECLRLHLLERRPTRRGGANGRAPARLEAGSGMAEGLLRNGRTLR